MKLETPEKMKKENATSSIANISWQERYHASQVYTLRCKIFDRPSMLGKLTTTIGNAGAHIGTIAVSGLESQHKIRDITVFCINQDHLNQVTKAVQKLDGVELMEIRNNVLESHYRGAIETHSRIPITNLTDLRMVYTPGVASICEKIVTEPASAWELTGLCDRVAIVTNGTAVLGLGDIGVLPSLPVMEGKAAIFAEFAGISAFPILVESKDTQTVIDTVLRIAPTFGAIQLEDIAAPACFEIEEKLQQALPIPVFHDDQHGTATVLLAALIGALKKTSRQAEKCSALILGAGAAGVAITKILLAFGIGDVVVYDSFGPIYRGRTEKMNPYKVQLAEITNKNNEKGPLAEGFKRKDIFIGVARPNMVSQDMIRAMMPAPLVFPLSNPVGEITVEQAYEAGAAIAVDGRTINNALAYPGLFRGALDAKAGDITFDMQIAAAHELARLTPEGDLLPNILDRQIHKQVAQAVKEAWQQSAGK